MRKSNSNALSPPKRDKEVGQKDSPLPLQQEQQQQQQQQRQQQ